METEFTKQLRLARETLDKKGAPIEGTAAGHLLLALEALDAALNEPPIWELQTPAAPSLDNPVEPML